LAKGFIESYKIERGAALLALSINLCVSAARLTRKLRQTGWYCSAPMALRTEQFTYHKVHKDHKVL
jgi:hypothetical protein